MKHLNLPQIVTVLLVPLIITGCKTKHAPERGIENDRELMSRHIQCDVKKYQLAIQDSIGYSKDSPYAFYYPNKLNNCNPGILIISKLKTDAVKKVKYTDVYLGELKNQVLYTNIKNDTLSFDFNSYHFDIMKDTIIVRIKI